MGPRSTTAAGPGARTTDPAAERPGPAEPYAAARNAPPDVDLETHIADVVGLIDALDAPDVVLVGHGYGVLPATGAADRRPGRVARIVYVDTAPPGDGEPALALLTVAGLREEAARLAGPGGTDRQGHAGPTADPAGRNMERGGEGPHGETVTSPAAVQRPAVLHGDTDRPAHPAASHPAPSHPAAPGSSAAREDSAPCGVQPPTKDEWHRHGSTDGLTDGDLSRLSRRAVPHPVATLVQPLRLTGAAAGLPTTGVLCTANGSSIALVENLVRIGEPRMAALARPGTGFFELPTGHWPMLSAPGDLARLLVRAAADEGRRIAAPGGELPPHLRPFVLDPPVAPRERIGRVDLHLPGADGPRPAIVLVHGGPVPETARPTPREWPGYLGWARLAASLGAVGAVLDHRLHGPADHERAAADVAAAVATVRAHPGVDGDRIALWYFSGGGLLAAEPLADPPPWLRCVAASYPVLAPLPGWGMSDSRFRPAEAIGRAGRLPVVVTRVGRELPEIAATVTAFLAAATACGAHVEVVDVPEGHHGFETVDRTEEARDGVRRAMRAVLGHLEAAGS
ncbi:alpha/beta hydrolase [Streptomyces sp. NPDC060194]|uniref:alpha/beta hydrolase n=1 Tax=Streptomyces sp. NPDC060194 TaxID=3347069 RepID=UPI003663F486